MPRVLLALLCAACVALPVLVVRFPPSTDLPQHVAQVRLFWEAVAEPDGLYRVQWLTPYSLVYAIVGGAWEFLGPADAGRGTVIVLGLLWVGAIHLCAAARRRPPGAAVLASLLFFSPILYWGFLSFAIGWPVFALWVLLTTRHGSTPLRPAHGALLFGGALLLYVTHALWFAVGMIWLVAHSLIFRLPWRTTLARLVSISPVVIVAALWYPQLSAAGFSSDTVFMTTPTARLSFSWLAAAACGGLRGATRYGAFAALAAWLGAVMYSHRSMLWSRIDHELLLAAGVLAAMALLMPAKHMNTILFAERWVAPAVTVLLLAFPAPIASPLVRRIVPATVLLVFSLSTAAAWVRFERTDLSGLDETLDALPAKPRIIGLDFLKASQVIADRPFVQTFAYAQVLRGGELNFSFAEFAPMLVVYRELPRRTGWTPSLEWFAERVEPSDFAAFDYAIVSGDERVHAEFAGRRTLEPITHEGVWRLYRIREAPP